MTSTIASAAAVSAPHLKGQPYRRRGDTMEDAEEEAPCCLLTTAATTEKEVAATAVKRLAHERTISDQATYLDAVAAGDSDADDEEHDDEDDHSSVASGFTVVCLSDRPAPVCVKTECRVNHPYQAPIQPYRPHVLPGVVHPALLQLCDFVHWPTSVEERAEDGLPIDPSFGTALLVSQVKFELTAGQLRWLLYRLVGVVVHRVTRHPAGFVVEAASEADRASLQRPFSRGVLFDQHGVWVARTEMQHKALISYLHQRQFRQRAQRLPRELLRIAAFRPTPPTCKLPPAYQPGTRGLK